MNKHTPGPWFATKDSQWNDVARIGRAWVIGSKLALSDFGHPDADAHLITAAPELLTALQKMCSVWVTVCNSHGWEPEHVSQYGAAREAIKKATGTP